MDAKDSAGNSSTVQSANDRLGQIALTCAIVAWIVESTLLVANLSGISSTINLVGIAVALTCWLFAVCGGLIAAIGWWSKRGLIALAVSLLLPVMFICLVALVGSGWKD